MSDQDQQNAALRLNEFFKESENELGHAYFVHRFFEFLIRNFEFTENKPSQNKREQPWKLSTPMPKLSIWTG